MWFLWLIVSAFSSTGVGLLPDKVSSCLFERKYMSKCHYRLSSCWDSHHILDVLQKLKYQVMNECFLVNIASVSRSTNSHNALWLWCYKPTNIETNEGFRTSPPLFTRLYFIRHCDCVSKFYFVSLNHWNWLWQMYRNFYILIHGLKIMAYIYYRIKLC